jgi:hypothetical protein
MRAREFTINIPINIRINGEGDPEISVDNDSNDDLQQNPVMVSPQQQELELKKAELGKSSPVINKLTANDSIGAEPNEDDRVIEKIKALFAR